MAIKITIPKPRPNSTPQGGFPARAASDLALVAAQFSRIGEKISLMWGSIELQQYLSGLIIDDRGGRQGFPPQIAAALARIYDEHGKLFPDDDSSAWDNLIR